VTLARPWTVAAVAATLIAALPACGVFKNNVEAQDLVNQRVVGKPAGAFFDAFGTPRLRIPLPDGTFAYNWVSEKTAAPNSGQYGEDTRTCTLRLIVGRDGRVTSAEVVLDNPGRTSTSRCTELFKGN
jgi:hypothetical protein